MLLGMHWYWAACTTWCWALYRVCILLVQTCVLWLLDLLLHCGNKLTAFLCHIFVCLFAAIMLFMQVLILIPSSYTYFTNCFRITFFFSKFDGDPHDLTRKDRLPLSDLPPASWHCLFSNSHFMTMSTAISLCQDSWTLPSLSSLPMIVESPPPAKLLGRIVAAKNGTLKVLLLYCLISFSHLFLLGE